ncbi:MAG: heparinase II/III-family protein, partial [Acidobacteriota bacterium]|nr:heparinase II/III-family protein [Acidobacteriota bacterium]
VSRGEEEILIDAGTFSYSDPAWRNKFRGSAAHNTVRIAGRDQAVPGGPFRWNLKPDVHMDQWDAGQGIVVATCSYAGFRHTRRVQLREERLSISDKIEGPPGDWLIEQFWHPGGTAVRDLEGLRIGSQARLVWGNGSTEEILKGGDYGWRSRGFGHKEPATVVRLSRTGSLPMSFEAALDFKLR